MPCHAIEMNSFETYRKNKHFNINNLSYILHCIYSTDAPATCIVTAPMGPGNSGNSILARFYISKIW